MMFLCAFFVVFFFSLLLRVILYYKCYFHIPTVPGWIPFFMHPSLLTFDPEELAEKLTDLRVALRKEKIFNSGLFKVWLGPFPFILVTQPEIAQQVFKNSTDKSTLYRNISFFFGNGLLTSNGHHHQYHRKIASKGFRMHNLHAAMVNAEESTKKFIQEITSDDFDNNLSRGLCKLLMDPFFKSVFNLDFNEMSEETTRQVNRLVICFTTLFINCLSKPSFDRFKHFTQIGREYDQLIQEIFTPLVDSIIAKKIQQVTNGEPVSTLDHLTAEYLSSNGKFTLSDLKDELNTFIIAGFETSYTSLRWIIETLGNHEDAQKNVCDELDGIFCDDRERPVTMDDLRRMVYLEASIKECLRLFTPVWLIGRRVDRTFTATTVDGKEYAIEKGCEVGLLLDDMHKMSNIYPDAEAFNPNRFLVNEDRHSHSFIPFATGNRICIGNRYAMIQLKTIIATILRKYQLKSQNDLCKIKKLTAFTYYPSVEPKFTINSRH